MQNGDLLLVIVRVKKKNLSVHFIVKNFLIYQDEADSIEHPPGYEDLTDDYSMPSIDEEKGR